MSPRVVSAAEWLAARKELLADEEQAVRALPHDESIAPIEYNYRTAQELTDMGEPFFARPGEQGGVSVFFREGDSVLHTWSGYGAVTDVLSGNDIRLDLTPLGRQDETVELLHHDRYPEEAR